MYVNTLSALSRLQIGSMLRSVTGVESSLEL